MFLEIEDTHLVEYVNQFKLKGYVRIKSCLDLNFCNLVFNYLKIRSIFSKNTVEDNFVPGTFALYADPLMESILMALRPLLREFSDCPISPTYSYCRLYKHGDVLTKHKDRLECEFSVTIPFGFEYLSKESQSSNAESNTWPIYMNGEPVYAEPGDVLIYRGIEVEHWRDEFKGTSQAQAFFHYISDVHDYSDFLRFDSRPGIGYPGESRDITRAQTGLKIATKSQGLML
jgi:hypothetical protein